MKDAEAQTLLSNIELTEELIEALLSKVDPNKLRHNWTIYNNFPPKYKYVKFK